MGRGGHLYKEQKNKVPIILRTGTAEKKMLPVMFSVADSDGF
jgi:hypothetical protein